MQRVQFLRPAGIALLGLAAYAPLWSAAPYRPDVPRFLGATVPALLFLALAVRWIRERSMGLPLVLALALAIRVAFILQPPSLSEDLYRYLWDGTLVREGIDPYRFPPEELADLQQRHAELYRSMAHRDRTSIYPPLAQMAFGAAVRLGGASPVAFKLLLLLAETALLYLWVFRLKVATENLALWLLHPLVILEFFSSGHVDLLALALLMWALYLSRRGRGFWAGLTWAAGVLVKLFPVIFFPLLLSQLRYWRTRVILIASGAAVVVGVPMITALWSDSPVESVRAFLGVFSAYHDTWQFNSLIFHYFPDRVPAGRLVTGLVIVAACMSALHARRAGWPELFSRFYFLGLFWCLVTPTLHPWYLSWVLISLPVLGLRYACALYLSVAILLSYLFYRLDPGGAQGWVLWLEFGPAAWLFYRDVRAYYDGPPWEGSDAI